jgi:hypothetical protein
MNDTRKTLNGMYENVKYIFNITDCGFCVADRCFTVAISERACPVSTEKTGPPTGDFTQRPVNSLTSAAFVVSHIIQSSETGPKHNVCYSYTLRNAFWLCKHGSILPELSKNYVICSQLLEQLKQGLIEHHVLSTLKL